MIYRSALAIDVTSTDQTLPRASDAILVGTGGNLKVDLSLIKSAQAFITTINPATGAITGVKLGFNGFGYLVAPTVNISSIWGTGANITCTITNGQVNSPLSIISGGLGYGIDPTIIATGTAQAGTLTTITLDALDFATDEAYQNAIIKITSGTGSGQIEQITDYNSATKIATVSWSTPPDDTSVYAIYFFKGAPNTTVKPQITFTGGRGSGSTLVVPAGIIPVSVSKVYHSGTSALNLTALYI